MNSSSNSLGPFVDVELASGKLRGQRRENGVAFKGIPYGRDTGGPRRFMPPEPPLPWTGVRDATTFGARAPQFDIPHSARFDWLFSSPASSEDCLVLNVYSPATTGKRPVMVWLHGGAFAFGSADVPVLDGGALASHGDVVVVTVNHRLGVFGYLASVSDDPRFADSGNAGMLDLVAALSWVRENIARFGGDPDSVTLFGQSGGGAKVAILMAMPQARNLFHRAIVQSPSSGFRVQEPEDAHRYAMALLARLGLSADRFEALQKVPAQQLLEAMAAVVRARGGDDEFRPVIDGRSLHRHPFYPDAPVDAVHMPMMIGYTALEASFYLAADPANQHLSSSQVVARVKRFMKLDDDLTAMQVVQRYAANHRSASPSVLLAHIASDHMYRLTTIEGAEQKASQTGSAPVYLYQFSWSNPDDDFLLAPHTAELPFVFGHVEMASAFTGNTETARALMRKVMDAWIRFARTGNPNGPGLPDWEPFEKERRSTLVFDAPDCSLQHDPGGDDRKVMSSYRRFVPGTALSFRAD